VVVKKVKWLQMLLPAMPINLNPTRLKERAKKRRKRRKRRMMRVLRKK
jgi:hypothetical protein